MTIKSDHKVTLGAQPLYIPETSLTEAICQEFAERLHKELITTIKKEVGFESGFPGERPTSLKELHFTRRIYIYHETPLKIEQREKLESLYKKKKLSVIFRGALYALERNNPGAPQDNKLD